MTHTESVNLLDYDRASLEAYFTSIGEKTFRASQVMKWIHQNSVGDFSAMTNLAKDLRNFLQDNALIKAPSHD